MTEKFEIRDKRTMDAQGNPRVEVGSDGRTAQAPPVRERPATEHPVWPDVREDPNFLPFVMNLAGMAYMSLGAGEGGLGKGAAPINLPEARYIIDSLDMLAGKTKGNLSPAEEKGLQSALYELKMQYAQAAGQKKARK